MSWYPDAIKKVIPPGANDPRIIPVGIIYHVRDGVGDSLHNYFDGPSGGIESHWYIRFDGTVEQYRDTRYEADANSDANSWISGGKRYGMHSVETEGREHGEWTSAQIESLKKLTVWDAEEHGFPLQVAPDWNGPGVGYHVMFGAPGPWTPISKSCPGPDRVNQFKQIFVPWLESGASAPDLEDDGMAAYTPEQIKAMFKQALGEALQEGEVGDTDVRQGLILLFQNTILKDPDVRREFATALLDYKNENVSRTGGRSVYQILLDAANN